jgi:hypothetical protein
MPVPIPFSPAYALLIVTWAGAYLLGRAAAERISRDRGLRAVLPFALALCAFLLAVHAASLLARSLIIGLPAGSITVAVAGIAAEIARRRAPAPPSEGRAPSPWMWLGMIAAVAVIAPAALLFDFHDELYFNGHMSIAAELQNGVYPPRHLSFPDFPLRYHYGFDLLVACLTALFRLSIERAIDAAILGLFALTFCLFWMLGERLLDRRRAWITPVLVLLGGGLPFGCPHPGPSIVTNVVVECKVGESVVNAPVISYFFQHPWSLGLPLAVSAILIFGERDAPRPRVRLATLGSCSR